MGANRMSFFSNLKKLSSLKVILLFSLLDAIACLFYWAYLEKNLESRFFNLARDRGFGEIVQYLKLGLLIYCVHKMYQKSRQGLLFSLVILFSVLLLDDAAGIHEFIGGLIINVFTLPSEVFGLRTKDLAEMVGILFLEGGCSLFVLKNYSSTAATEKRFFHGLLLATVPLALFGTVFDLLPFSNLEQVGEMLAMSVLLFYVHRSFRLF
jgi:hypothetical protein